MLPTLQLEIECSFCLNLIWHYNRMMLPTTHPLQRHQITTLDLFANAWFFCVSQTFWCWCNWNQHRVNETPWQGSASVEVVTVWWLYTVCQSFCCVWLCACKIHYIVTSTHRWSRTHSQTLVNTSMAFPYMQSLAVKYNTTWDYSCNFFDCAFALDFQQQFIHLPLWSTSIFLPSSKHQLFSLLIPLSLWLIYGLVSTEVPALKSSVFHVGQPKHISCFSLTLDI